MSRHFALPPRDPGDIRPHDGRGDTAEPDGWDYWLEQLGRPECEPLSRDEEHALAVRAHAGDTHAREQLITHNLRLVVSVARRYTGRGVELLDLVAAGNRGLMHGIDLFNPHSGNRLSTYATHWIRQRVKRVVEDEGRTVRIPNRFFTLAKRDELDSYAFLVPLSLDEPLDYTEADDALPTFHDFVADEATPVDEQVEAANAQGEAWGELVRLFRRARLTLREQRVLALRYAGGQGGGPMTLDRCGAALGITRERVRQIEAKAMRKLRVAAGVMLPPSEREPPYSEQAEMWQVSA